MATTDHNNPSILKIDSSELDHLRSNVLKSQIATYRLLARNLPVPDSLLNSCSYKSQLATLIHKQIQQEQTKPTAIILSNISKSNEQKPNETSLTFSSATNMYQWLIDSNDNNEEKIPKRIQRHPIHLNPLYIQQECDRR